LTAPLSRSYSRFMGTDAHRLTIIGDIVSPRQRGRYQGYLGAVFAFASVAGPLIGGFFADHLTWRWVFYVNLPIGVVALVVTSVVLDLPFRRIEHAIDFVGAALVMAMTKTLLRAHAAFQDDPAQVLSAVNTRLYEETDPAMFVTAFCGFLDLRDGRLRYSNAGHEPPFLRSGRAVDRLQSKAGLPLGVLRSFVYVVEETVLNPSDSTFQRLKPVLGEAHAVLQVRRHPVTTIIILR